MEKKNIISQEEKIKKLKEIFPEVFDKKKINWDKLKTILELNLCFSNEEYALRWTGKKDILRILKEPSTKILIPQKKQSNDFENTGNFFIEGDNLQVLKILQRSYDSKIKMIYIDPPYNTRSTYFIDTDNQVKDKQRALKMAGYKNINGYWTKDGVIYQTNKSHSDWLNMMYPRLSIAKTLLQDDGVIFVSINDCELHNLRLIMDEIFGEVNFVQTFMWLHGRDNKDRWSRTLQQYILCYAKNKQSLPPLSIPININCISSNFDNDPRGNWFLGDISFADERSNKQHPNYYDIKSPSGKIWKKQWTKEYWEINELLKDNRIFFGQPPKYDSVPKVKIFSNDNNEQIPSNIIVSPSIKVTQDYVDKILGKNIFLYPKPIELIKYIIGIVTNSNDIILDFFAGSATTAHAVIDLNREDGGFRKYICVQLPELCEQQSAAYQAGYKNITEIGKERIRRVAKEIANKNKLEIKDLQKKIDKLTNNLNTQERQKQIYELQARVAKLKKQDLGFQVFELQESNLK